MPYDLWRVKIFNYKNQLVATKNDHYFKTWHSRCNSYRKQS